MTRKVVPATAQGHEISRLAPVKCAPPRLHALQSAITRKSSGSSRCPAAGVKGGQATPKGLRHGFGVSAIQSKVPLNLVQRWLGHADIKTTAIYTSAMGEEERQIAAQMWQERPEDRKENRIQERECSSLTSRTFEGIVTP